jgi:hypothetical protein
VAGESSLEGFIRTSSLLELFLTFQMARLPFCVAKVDIVFQIRKSFEDIFQFFFFRAFICPQFAIFAKCRVAAVA